MWGVRVSGGCRLVSVFLGDADQRGLSGNCALKGRENQGGEVLDGCV